MKHARNLGTLPHLSSQDKICHRCWNKKRCSKFKKVKKCYNFVRTNPWKEEDETLLK